MAKINSDPKNLATEAHNRAFGNQKQAKDQRSIAKQQIRKGSAESLAKSLKQRILQTTAFPLIELKEVADLQQILFLQIDLWAEKITNPKTPGTDVI